MSIIKNIFKSIYLIFKFIFVEIYNLFKYVFLSFYYLLILILFIPKFFINTLADILYAIYLKVKRINASINKFFERFFGRIRRNLKYKYNNLSFVKKRKNKELEKEKQEKFLNSTKTIFKVVVSNTTEKPIYVKSINVEAVNKEGKIIEKMLVPIEIKLNPAESKEISIKSKLKLREDVMVRYTINK